MEFLNNHICAWFLFRISRGNAPNNNSEMQDFLFFLLLKQKRYLFYISIWLDIFYNVVKSHKEYTTGISFIINYYKYFV